MLTRLDDGLLQEALPLPDKWTVFSDSMLHGRRLSDIPWCIGVYAIYVAGELIYIGMSQVGIGTRLSKHFVRHRSAPAGMLWSAQLQRYVRRDQIVTKVRCCRPESAMRREEALVWRLKPSGNRVIFHRGRRYLGGRL